MDMTGFGLAYLLAMIITMIGLHIGAFFILG